MRAGSLDRTIIIERASTTLDAAGTPQQTWTTLVTLRAAKSDDAIAETQSQQGAVTERAVTFLTRFYPGVTVADRLSFDGQTFNLLGVKEVGRRRGLEMRCERVGP